MCIDAVVCSDRVQCQCCSAVLGSCVRLVTLDGAALQSSRAGVVPHQRSCTAAGTAQGAPERPSVTRTGIRVCVSVHVGEYSVLRCAGTYVVVYSGENSSLGSGNHPKQPYSVQQDFLVSRTHGSDVQVMQVHVKQPDFTEFHHSFPKIPP